MKIDFSKKLYRILGLVLCGCAGAAVGFVLASATVGLLGIFPGVIAGHFLACAVGIS